MYDALELASAMHTRKSWLILPLPEGIRHSGLPELLV